MLAFYLSQLTTKEEEDLFTGLYETYWPLMKHIARDTLVDKTLVEDAVHNAFVNIIEHIGDFDEVVCHKSRFLIVIIIKRVAIDMNRYRTRHTAQDVDIEPLIPVLRDDVDPLDRLSANEIAEMVYELPPIYRDVLAMKGLMGLSTDHIARSLGLKSATVRKRLERSRALFREVLKKHGY